MLDIEQLKKLQDKMYEHGQTTRERAADDMVFYWVTQWDDNLLGDSQLQYKGEFNILRKAGRQIISDLRSNPVQVNFEPKAATRDDGADLIDGLYRADDRVNTSLEAYDNASGEAVVCGVGAWELYTEYETNQIGDENQVIRRRPIYEANNNCFYDPNSKRLDKSDMNHGCVLVAYSEDGYKDLVKDLTGEEPDNAHMSSFSEPEDSFAFPWITGKSRIYYVANFYHRELVKDKILFLTDPLGQELVLKESDLEDVMDELIETGYTIDDERTREIKRYKVTKYIASGAEILKTYTVPGEHIPIIPVYGERAFIEGEEHYEGATRLAKDPQRLRNFQLSYLADIVSRSPRPKPIFHPEQISGFEFMYEENGADSNYPYYLMNRKDANGEQLPIGPASEMPEQRLPEALMASIQQSRIAVEDVANPGMPQEYEDSDLSGKAVALLQNRLDQQSLVYQQNMKHAKRRDAEIYASMATQIFDAPREVTISLPDGSRKKVQMMEAIQDKETGELVVLNDITNMQFDVFADIGPNYTTRKEETMDRLDMMMQRTPDPQLQKMLLLKSLSMVDGVNMDDVRDYANKQLIIGGYKEPETEEEIALLQQAMQNKKPDPNELIGQAEMLKAQIAQAKEQREMLKDGADVESQNVKNQIAQFEAETERMDSQIDAQKAGADINYTNIKAFNERLQAVSKASQFRARLN